MSPHTYQWVDLRRIWYDQQTGFLMAQATAKNSVTVLSRDRSKRAAYAACLRAVPFCTSTETLQVGVERLDKWLRRSVALSHSEISQVVVVVLACFQLSSCSVNNVDELNDTWIKIVREILSPQGKLADEKYLLHARMLALCTLYFYIPWNYAGVLVTSRFACSCDCPCEIKLLIESLQRSELAERARETVVGKLVRKAVRNVLDRAREEAKVQQRRAKKTQRKRTQSTGLVFMEERRAECERQVEVNTPVRASAPSCTPSDPVAVAADECVVCLDALGSKRPLFTCGHARCCAMCAALVRDCPMCRLPAQLIMEIYV